VDCTSGLRRHRPTTTSLVIGRTSLSVHLGIGSLGVATIAKGYEAYHWAMSRIHPGCSDSTAPDRSVAADVVLRQERDEEEDEEEDDGKEDDHDDDEDDDGYSEMSQARRRLRSDVELPVPTQRSPLDFVLA
jgi:hypothetical protein